MRNKGLYIRLSEQELSTIKSKAGKNISEWVRKTLCPKDEVNESILMDKMLESKFAEPAKRRCMKSHCKSIDTKVVIIHGLKAYLCNDHSNENPFI